MSEPKTPQCPDCHTPFESVAGVPATTPELCANCGRRFVRFSETAGRDIVYVYGEPNRITYLYWYEWDSDLSNQVKEDLERLSTEVAPNSYRLGEVFCQGNGHYCGPVLVETPEERAAR